MNEETFRKREYQFFEENKSKASNLKRKDIKDRLYTKSVNAPKIKQRVGTIRSVMNERLDLVHESKIMTKDNITKLKRPHQSYFSKKTDNKIQMWSNSHQQNNPKKTKKSIEDPKQIEAKLMCKFYRNIDFVIDDESYFTLEHSNKVGDIFSLE